MRSAPRLRPGPGLLLALVLAAPIAPSYGDPSRAATLKSAADKAYGEGDYFNALKLLQAAYAAHPDPALRANIGLVYRALGEYGEAVKALRAFLESQPPADKARIAQELLAELEPEVQLDSQPPGAAIYLDDAPQPVGQTPARLRWVAGAHQVVLKLPGHQPASRALVVRRGEPQQLSVRLEPLAAAAIEAAAQEAPAAPGLAAGVTPAAGPSRAGAWALIGLGAAAAGGAIAAQLLGRGAADDRDGAATGAEWDDRHAAVGTWSWVFWGSAGLSLAALGAGVALLSRGDSASPVSLQLGPAGAGLGGRF